MYAVGDVHGHRAQLITALRSAGLVDSDTQWSGGDATVWFLGDFVDRGPDGVGVIDLVMDLADGAREAGGRVDTLLGNHEILLLGTHRFGDAEVPSDSGLIGRSFERSWRMNGGLASDQAALTEEHIGWLTERPVLELVGDHLLMHSDTEEYLTWGDDIESINAGVREVLTGDDLSAWWEVWRRLTTRYAFRGGDGAEVADRLLGVLGGSRLVHGHSVIADQLGVAPPDIDGPVLYAGGRALGIDGGVFIGGPCLVVELPYAEIDTAEVDTAEVGAVDVDTVDANQV